MHFVWPSTLALATLAPVLIAAATTCPDGSSPPTANGITACCPGILSANGDAATCLLGCYQTSSACFPFCTGVSNHGIFTVGTCTPVPVTESDYTSIVYSEATATTATTTETVKTTGATSDFAASTAGAATTFGENPSTAANAGTTSGSSRVTTPTPASISTAAAPMTDAPIVAQAVLGVIAGLAMH